MKGDHVLMRLYFLNRPNWLEAYLEAYHDALEVEELEVDIVQYQGVPDSLGSVLGTPCSFSVSYCLRECRIRLGWRRETYLEQLSFRVNDYGFHCITSEA